MGSGIWKWIESKRFPALISRANEIYKCNQEDYENSMRLGRQCIAKCSLNQDCLQECELFSIDCLKCYEPLDNCQNAQCKDVCKTTDSEAGCQNCELLLCHDELQAGLNCWSDVRRSITIRDDERNSFII